MLKISVQKRHDYFNGHRGCIMFGVWKKEGGMSIVTNNPLLTTQTQQEILNSYVSCVRYLNYSTSNDEKLLEQK